MKRHGKKVQLIAENRVILGRVGFRCFRSSTMTTAADLESPFSNADISKTATAVLIRVETMFNVLLRSVRLCTLFLDIVSLKLPEPYGRGRYCTWKLL